MDQALRYKLSGWHASLNAIGFELIDAALWPRTDLRAALHEMRDEIEAALRPADEYVHTLPSQRGPDVDVRAAIDAVLGSQV